jgi:3'-phosphoadenosine 5'-phosphosulfate sulfotransferase (PAPS reductase)/FAD synthetase
MKIALQFSGGIDSLACLWITRGMPNVTVYWGKTDGAYPDMEHYIRSCCKAAELPLRIVEGDRGIAEHGYPNDADPESVFACCSRGLWKPMHQAMVDDGVEVVIRGQRDDDLLRAAIGNGYRDDRGITYLFPLAVWDRYQVVQYVNDVCPHLVHESYSMGEVTGRDCWDCTGYLFDNAQRIINLPDDKRKFVLQHIGGIAS